LWAKTLKMGGNLSHFQKYIVDSIVWDVMSIETKKDSDENVPWLSGDEA